MKPPFLVGEIKSFVTVIFFFFSCFIYFFNFLTFTVFLSSPVANTQRQRKSIINFKLFRYSAAL